MSVDGGGVPGAPEAAPARAMIISSDGHAIARMADFEPYVPVGKREEFRAFLSAYRQQNLRNFDPEALARRIDDDGVDEWAALVEGGRLEGQHDPARRIEELDRDGVTGEVLFPDNGALPFEMYPPLVALARGHTRTQEEVDAGNKAYNRWLVDFVAVAPERWAGLVMVGFHDVAAAVREIRWAKDAGFKGVLLPEFPESAPLFNPEYDPIWATLVELGLPANCHPGRSSTTTNPPVQVGALTTVATHIPILGTDVFYYTQRILKHMIWGGVLERHPGLEVAFTEQGSGWVLGALEGMDYSYEGSHLRRDVRDVVRIRPSEYFARQCHLGSSIFSRAEIAARAEIGVDKIMLGVDYPHHEGTWARGTVNYLRATLGAAGVPVGEAESMLGHNAARLFGFDVDALRPVADRIGVPMAEVLEPPVEDLYPRGDVRKPLGTPA